MRPFIIATHCAFCQGPLEDGRHERRYKDHKWELNSMHCSRCMYNGKFRFNYVFQKENLAIIHLIPEAIQLHIEIENNTMYFKEVAGRYDELIIAKVNHISYIDMESAEDITNKMKLWLTFL